MREWGLGDEFRYRGAVDRVQKIAFLRDLDVLSVPGPYPDPKGTYLLEAMAAGTPVVQPRRGAFAETIERTGGGLLVEPTTEALAEGLLTIARHPDLGARHGPARRRRRRGALLGRAGSGPGAGSVRTGSRGGRAQGRRCVGL